MELLFVVQIRAQARTRRPSTPPGEGEDEVGESRIRLTGVHAFEVQVFVSQRPSRAGRRFWHQFLGPRRSDTGSEAGSDRLAGLPILEFITIHMAQSGC